MRSATVTRKTNETDITVTFNLDGSGNTGIDTGIGFFDHMLTLFAFHGFFDLDIRCEGDLHVDCHHTVEDIGLVLGKAFRGALGSEPDIKRYGTSYVPMDDALTRTVVDVSGRPYLVFKCTFTSERIGTLETETVSEFFKAFVRESRINIHIDTFYGDNAHHKIESIFKSFGRALDDACTKVNRGIPSTKGAM